MCMSAIDEGYKFFMHYNNDMEIGVTGYNGWEDWLESVETEIAVMARDLDTLGANRGKAQMVVSDAAVLWHASSRGAKGLNATAKTAGQPEWVKRFYANRTKTNSQTTKSAKTQSTVQRYSRSANFGKGQVSEIVECTIDSTYDLTSWSLSPDGLAMYEKRVYTSLCAAVDTLTLSAALEAAPALIEIIRELIAKGSFDDIALINEEGIATVSGAVRSLLLGAAIAAITYSMAEGKFGTEDEVLKPAVVGVAATLIVKTVLNTVKASSGKMTTKELAALICRDSLISACSLSVCGYRQEASQIPAFGYLLGSFVGSAIGGFMWSYEPYTIVAVLKNTDLPLFGWYRHETSDEAFARDIGQIANGAFIHEPFGKGLFSVGVFMPDSPLQPLPWTDRIGIREVSAGLFDVSIA